MTLLAKGTHLHHDEPSWTSKKLKISVDGSITARSTERVVAGVLWHVSGSLLDEFAKKKKIKASSPVQVEAVEALKHFRSRREDELYLLSDCSVVVDTLLKTEEAPWEIKSIILKAQALLAHFKKIFMAHCSRTENRVADYLAHHGTHSYLLIVKQPPPLSPKLTLF